MKADISKYNFMLVTDRHRSMGRDDREVVGRAIAGGVRLFQLREPDMADGEIYRLAMDILPEIRSPGGLLILNDRVDVCIACDADGVHLGANDLPIDVARRVLGDGKLIGFSAHTAEQALHAASEGADYITLSPAFELKHKESKYEPHTYEELWAIADMVDMPVYFLGGITLQNIESLKKPGKVLRAAVVSAITGSANIESAAEGLLNAAG
jgi:thiamine-phosphate pyrophosphorylase